MCSIQEDNNYHLSVYKYSAPSASYLAGFIDGDGCIFIRKLKGGYQSGISFAQSRTNILQVVRHHFGGSITSSFKRNSHTNDEPVTKHTKRNQYNLNIRSNEYIHIMNYVRYSIIIKQMQIDCLVQFSKLCNQIGLTEEKEKLYQQCSTLNKVHSSKSEYDFSRINIDYISGIFDAEGCIYMNSQNYRKFYVKITQKN